MTIRYRHTSNPERVEDRETPDRLLEQNRRWERVEIEPTPEPAPKPMRKSRKKAVKNDSTPSEPAREGAANDANA